MEMYRNTRCVTFSELVGGGVISEANLKWYIRKEVIKTIRRGCRNQEALYSYDSLPNQFKDRYDDRFPNARKEMEERTMSEWLTYDGAAVEFYETHLMPNGKRLADDLQKEYVLNAQVLNEMLAVEGSTRAGHRKGGNSHDDIVWQKVLGTCEKLREKYHHTLPKGEVTLKRKIARYKNEGYVAVISGKVGNQNTVKITAAGARYILKLRRSRTPMYTESQIFGAYNKAITEGKLKEKPLKSPGSIRNFLGSPEIEPLWWDVVYGEQAWKDKYCAGLSTEMPVMRDALWYSDGTKLNLFFKYHNEKGHLCVGTTMVYEVMDAYSEVLLGYDIFPKECFESQYRAFRMAVENTRTKVFELVYDGQGGHKKKEAQELFSAISHMHHLSSPYNGSSKTIESVFGRIQASILRKYKNFTGMNITATKKNSRADMDLIMANKEMLPTLEEVKKIYAECRREWNTSVHPKSGLVRSEMYEMSHNPRTPRLTDNDLKHLFWKYHENAILYTKEGIEFSVNKQEYKFEVYAGNVRDNDFAMHNIGRKLHLRYDPMNLTEVDLYKEEASGKVWVGTAKPKFIFGRGMQDRPIEQTRGIREQLEANDALRAAAVLAREEFDNAEGIALEKSGWVNPGPKSISDKRMKEYRDEAKHGRLKTPIVYPVVSKEQEEPEEEYNYASVGEYYKDLSNKTMLDFLNNY